MLNLTNEQKQEIEIEARMVKLINRLDWKGLERLYKKTMEMGVNERVTLRELIMDRLEMISAELFEQWLDDENENFEIFKGLV